MSRERIEKIVCDSCGKDLTERKHQDIVRIEDVPNEGASTIFYNGNDFDLDNSDYCNLDCLLSHIKKILLRPIEVEGE